MCRFVPDLEDIITFEDVMKKQDDEDGAQPAQPALPEETVEAAR